MEIKQKQRQSKGKLTSDTQIKKDAQNRSSSNIKARKDAINIKQKQKRPQNKLKSNKKSKINTKDKLSSNMTTSKDISDNGIKNSDRYDYNKDDKDDDCKKMCLKEDIYNKIYNMALFTRVCC